MRGGVSSDGGRRMLLGKAVQFKGRNENQRKFGCGDCTEKLTVGNWYTVCRHDPVPLMFNTLKLSGISGVFDSCLFRLKTDR